MLVLTPESHVYFFKTLPFFYDCSVEKHIKSEGKT